MTKAPYSLNIKGKLLEIDRPLVMGILNITPDSFHSESRVMRYEEILSRADDMLEAGADILDIGAQSTRPGAEIITAEEEMRRLKGIISGILEKHPEAVISIDTFRHEVAQQSIAEGASIINDVSAGDMDPMMFRTVADQHVPYIIMHHEGIPASSNPDDNRDKTGDVVRFFSKKINTLVQLGINDLILDPGFGFGKNKQQNLMLMQSLNQLTMFGFPVLAGISRKKTIQQVLQTDAAGSLNGTTAMNMIALMKGASILRVHDVKEAREAIAIWHAVENPL